MENMLSDIEAAAFLDVTEETLRTMVDEKVVPAYMVGGKFLRFKKEELEAIRDILMEIEDSAGERIFNKSYAQVTGLERFRDFLKTNDVYLVLAAVVLIIIVMIWPK